MGTTRAKRGLRSTVVALILLGSNLLAPAPASAEEEVDRLVLVEPNGCWHVRVPGAPDYTFSYGVPGDVPLLGDWDGDGYDTPGAYRPSNGFAYLTNQMPRDGGGAIGDPDLTFFFGNPGDQVVVGDWDGNGTDTLGIRRRGKMFLTNVNATSVADTEFFFGVEGDTAFGGDPDGDGSDGIYLYRPSSGFVYFANAVRTGFDAVAPTAGEFFYGVPSDAFEIGDWDGDGIDTAGVFRPDITTVYLRNTLGTGLAHQQYEWGYPDWATASGRLRLDPRPSIGTCAAPTSPLTGLTGGNAERQTVIAKFSNSSKARPQEGINDADLVIEVIVEWGVGRWLAFYQTNYPETVGPLRSVREVDPKLIEPFDARILHSGGQKSVRNAIAEIASDDGAWTVAGYRREPGRPAVYDVMFDFDRLAESDWSGTVNPILEFAWPVPAGAEDVPAGRVTVEMSSVNVIDWQFDGTGYQRGQNGRLSNDSDGQPITAETVVVVMVEELDTGRRDSAGSIVPDYEVVGSGEAYVFRNGKAFVATWERANNGEFFRFVGADGEPIPFKPGTTWFHLTPTTGSVAWS